MQKCVAFSETKGFISHNTWLQAKTVGKGKKGFISHNARLQAKKVFIDTILKYHLLLYSFFQKLLKQIV